MWPLDTLFWPPLQLGSPWATLSAAPLPPREGETGEGLRRQRTMQQMGQTQGARCCCEHPIITQATLSIASFLLRCHFTDHNCREFTFLAWKFQTLAFISSSHSNTLGYQWKHSLPYKIIAEMWNEVLFKIEQDRNPSCYFILFSLTVFRLVLGCHCKYTPSIPNGVGTSALSTSPPMNLAYYMLECWPLICGKCRPELQRKGGQISSFLSFLETGEHCAMWIPKFRAVCCWTALM